MKHEEPIRCGNTPEDIFNIKCGEYLDYETMFMGFGTHEVLYYAPMCDGWDNPEEYNPWGNIEQLMEVLETLVERKEMAESDYIGLITDMQDYGVVNTLRHIVTDILITDADRHEQPELSVFFDFNAREFHEEGNYFVFDNNKEEEGCQYHFREKPEVIYDRANSLKAVGDPSSLYWQAVNILANANYHGFCNFYYTGANQYVLGWEGDKSNHTEDLQLFMDTTDGLLQLMTIENYIRSCDNHFNGLYEGVLEQHPIGEWLRDESDTTLESIHQHRKYIVRKCLDRLAEPYESDEKQFNRLCEKIRLAGEYPGCGIDLSTHRPYSDILQLSKIVEKIVEMSNVPFVFNNADEHIMDTMRTYVLEFSKEQYVDLSPLEETP